MVHLLLNTIFFSTVLPHNIGGIRFTVIERKVLTIFIL